MAHRLKLREKLMLLELAAYRKNVAAACEYMGISRFTYYQIKKAYDQGGVEALAKKSRKVPNLKNRVPKHVEQAVLKLSIEYPSLGKKKMSEVLKENGNAISSTGVRNVWVWHDLLTTEDRVNAMLDQVKNTGEALSQIQLRALEKLTRNGLTD